MMVCSNCQNEIANNSNFCYNCGAKQAAPGYSAPASNSGSGKRLMRSSVDKKIAGVCAGLADYFDLDVTIIRICWLLAFFCAGTGLLVYIILWIALPLAPAGVMNTSAPIVT